MLALCLIAGACSGGVPAATTASVGLRQAALEFAATADRALDETRFADVAPGTIADLVVAVCGDPAMLDVAIAAAAGSIDAPPGPVVDDAILTEVLTEGVREACPDRAGAAEVIAAYLASVHAAAASVAPEAQVDDAAVLAAGPVACDLLDRGQGAEAALFGVVAALFGIEAATIAELEADLTPEQGVVAGAALASASTILCSVHAHEVEAYLTGP